MADFANEPILKFFDSVLSGCNCHNLDAICLTCVLHRHYHSFSALPSVVESCVSHQGADARERQATFKINPRRGRVAGIEAIGHQLVDDRLPAGKPAVSGIYLVEQNVAFARYDRIYAQRAAVTKSCHLDGQLIAAGQKLVNG